MEQNTKINSKDDDRLQTTKCGYSKNNTRKTYTMMSQMHNTRKHLIVKFNILLRQNFDQ